MENFKRMNKHLKYFNMEIKEEGEKTILLRNNDVFGELSYVNSNVALSNTNGEPHFSFIDSSKDKEEKVSLYFCEGNEKINIHTVYSWDKHFASIRKSFHGCVKGKISLEVFDGGVYFSFSTMEKEFTISLSFDQKHNLFKSMSVIENDGIVKKEESFEINDRERNFTVTTALLPTNSNEQRKEIAKFKHTLCFWDDHFKWFVKKEIVQRALNLLQDSMTIYCPELSEKMINSFPAYAYLMTGTDLLLGQNNKKIERKPEK